MYTQSLVSFYNAVTGRGIIRTPEEMGICESSHTSDPTLGLAKGGLGVVAIPRGISAHHGRLRRRAPPIEVMSSKSR